MSERERKELKLFMRKEKEVNGKKVSERSNDDTCLCLRLTSFISSSFFTRFPPVQSEDAVCGIGKIEGKVREKSFTNSIHERGEGRRHFLRLLHFGNRM